MSITPSRLFTLKKPTYLKISCFFAIFGFLQFILLTFFAALFYPGGYDYFQPFYVLEGNVQTPGIEKNGGAKVSRLPIIKIHFSKKK